MDLMLIIPSGKPGRIDVKQTGRRIKETCAQKGLTVKKIQEELYIGSFQSVYAWFSGKSLPNLDNMYRLSRLLGLPMEALIVDTAKEAWVLLEEWARNTDLDKRGRILAEKIAVSENTETF